MELLYFFILFLCSYPSIVCSTSATGFRAERDVSDLFSGVSLVFSSSTLSRRRLMSFCSCNLLVKKMRRQPTSCASAGTSGETVLQQRRTACSQNSSEPHNYPTELRSTIQCCKFKRPKITFPAHFQTYLNTLFQQAVKIFHDTNFFFTFYRKNPPAL